MATAAMSRAEYLASCPIEGLTCGGCGADGCLAYPAIETEGVRQHPTTICPNCSTPAIEDYLRFAAERGAERFQLKPIRAFATPAGPLAHYEALVDQLGDFDRKNLEVAWHATEGGSNCTAEFGYTDDGQTGYFEGGPKPSFALALLFDFENFMAGRDSAMPWEVAS